MAHTREVDQPLPILCRLGAVVTPEQMEGIKARAVLNDRSVSAEVRRAITAYLEQPPEQPLLRND